MLHSYLCNIHLAAYFIRNTKLGMWPHENNSEYCSHLTPCKSHPSRSQAQSAHNQLCIIIHKWVCGLWSYYICRVFLFVCFGARIPTNTHFGTHSHRAWPPLCITPQTLSHWYFHSNLQPPAVASEKLGTCCQDTTPGNSTTSSPSSQSRDHQHQSLQHRSSHPIILLFSDNNTVTPSWRRWSHKIYSYNNK